VPVRRGGRSGGGWEGRVGEKEKEEGGKVGGGIRRRGGKEGETISRGEKGKGRRSGVRWGRRV